MSASRAIQVSIQHVAAGVMIGALIEALLPTPDVDASWKQQIFETLVQAGLNGALLASLSSFLVNDDPTFGIPFSMALFASQPELAARIQSLAALTKSQVVLGVQRTAPLIPGV